MADLQGIAAVRLEIEPFRASELAADDIEERAPDWLSERHAVNITRIGPDYAEALDYAD
jgi:hypothetical protein